MIAAGADGSRPGLSRLSTASIPAWSSFIPQNSVSFPSRTCHDLAPAAVEPTRRVSGRGVSRAPRHARRSPRRRGSRRSQIDAPASAICWNRPSIAVLARRSPRRTGCSPATCQTTSSARGPPTSRRRPSVKASRRRHVRLRRSDVLPWALLLRPMTPEPLPPRERANAGQRSARRCDRRRAAPRRGRRRRSAPARRRAAACGTRRESASPSGSITAGTSSPR